MILKSISLSNFRSFSKSTFYFNPFLTIITGKNAVGKTNLLESIYFAFNGKGIKGEKQSELVALKKTRTTVEVICGEEDEKILYRIILEAGETTSKIFQVNKAKKTRFDYTNYTPPVVIFAPQLINVIEGSPSRRRRYIDAILSKLNREYKRRLTNFEQGLRKRNKLLEKVYDVSKLTEELVFWDNYLIEQAGYLTRKREELSNYLNEHQKIKTHTFSIKYKKSALTPQALESSFNKQLRYKRTVVGPQRDDFEIYKLSDGEKINVHTFGSRSEERLAMFWLVTNELKLYEERLKKRPILLLDDIFSELDVINKSLILELLKKHQTILTTTEHDILDLIDSPHVVINL